MVFDTCNGTTTRAVNIAAWEIDHLIWSAIGAGLPSRAWHDGVHALRVFEDDQGVALFAGGYEFQDLNRCLARWSGQVWEGRGEPLSCLTGAPYIESLCVWRGKLICAGHFHQFARNAEDIEIPVGPWGDVTSDGVKRTDGNPTSDYAASRAWAMDFNVRGHEEIMAGAAELVISVVDDPEVMGQTYLRVTIGDPPLDFDRGEPAALYSAIQDGIIISDTQITAPGANQAISFNGDGLSELNARLAASSRFTIGGALFDAGACALLRAAGAKLVIHPLGQIKEWLMNLAAYANGHHARIGGGAGSVPRLIPEFDSGSLYCAQVLPRPDKPDVEALYVHGPIVSVSDIHSPMVTALTNRGYRGFSGGLYGDLSGGTWAQGAFGFLREGGWKFVAVGNFRYGLNPGLTDSEKAKGLTEIVTARGVIRYNGRRWVPMGQGLGVGPSAVVRWNDKVTAAGTALSPRAFDEDTEEWSLVIASGTTEPVLVNGLAHWTPSGGLIPERYGGPNGYAWRLG